MHIVLDAMGSDAHPVPDVEGAVLAAREYGISLSLVGNRVLIEQELQKHDTTGLDIRVVHTDEFISMTDKPVEAAKAKQNSSMHIGMRMVESGEADAFVTAGNTGGVLAVATLHVPRRIPGVKRPTLTTIINIRGNRIVLTDIGANAECRPEHLYQFAIMAGLYAERALGVHNPRIALLSNAEEEGKGTELVREAAKLLAASDLNYIGPVEPKEVLAGKADAVISDGFSGNILIKSLEAMASTIFAMLKDELPKSPLTVLGGLLARPAFKRVYKHLDPFEIGGAPLLGVNGVVIIAHGRSNSRGIKNAIRQAVRAVEGDIITAIRRGIAANSGAGATSE